MKFFPFEFGVMHVEDSTGKTLCTISEESGGLVIKTDSPESITIKTFKEKL